jgi:DNA-binding PucR family transcriptional regulator
VGTEEPVDWAALGSYRSLATLLGDRDPAPLVPAAIDLLLAERDGLSLVETAETYLDRGGDAKGTADALYLHRSSLYKRLHRIERLTGYDLRQGDDRLELHLGLRLWRLAGRRSSPPRG